MTVMRKLVAPQKRNTVHIDMKDQQKYITMLLNLVMFIQKTRYMVWQMKKKMARPPEMANGMPHHFGFPQLSDLYVVQIDASELDVMRSMMEMKSSWYMSQGLLIQNESNRTLNSAANERQGMSDDSIPTVSCLQILNQQVFLLSIAWTVNGFDMAFLLKPTQDPTKHSGMAKMNHSIGRYSIQKREYDRESQRILIEFSMQRDVVNVRGRIDDVAKERLNQLVPNHILYTLVEEQPPKKVEMRKNIWSHPMIQSSWNSKYLKFLNAMSSNVPMTTMIIWQPAPKRTDRMNLRFGGLNTSLWCCFHPLCLSSSISINS